MDREPRADPTGWPASFRRPGTAAGMRPEASSGMFHLLPAFRFLLCLALSVEATPLVSTLASSVCC